MSSVDEATQTQIRNIEAQTGKTLEELIRSGLATGMVKHKELQEFFANEYSLTFGNANVVTIFTRDRLKGADGQQENFVDAQYADKRAALQPIYDALIGAVQAFGKDVEIAPKRTYVSLRRRKQFGLVQPGAGRVDLGINLQGIEPAGRLEKSGSFNSMVSHRVRLTSPADVDDVLVAWLRQAYDQA